MIDRACISLTSKCQLSCTYCHFEKHIDKNTCTDLDVKSLYEILQNIKEYADKNDISFKIGLVGAGEPLIRFDLIQETVNFLSKNDIAKRISLYTISNGVYCTQEMMKFFYENQNYIKIGFSLDGNAEIHDACRKFKNGAPSFKKVWDTIELYKKYFGKMPSVNATVHKRSIHDADIVLQFFEDNFSEVTFSRLVDEQSPELYISKEEFNSFMEKARLTNLALRQFRLPKKYDCTMYGQLCGVGRTNIFFADGKIYPCGRFVGNESFALGTEHNSLFEIERTMKRIIPCKDGQCYFDENVLEARK